MKKIAILQSNYIPWKGYFDMINMVDEFVLYDDMQYTKRDWRNRNLIKTQHGIMWLTIPVVTKGRFEQKIRETEIVSSKWCMEHWNALQMNYAKATCFNIYKTRIFELYKRCEDEKYLSRINYLFLTYSSDYTLYDGKTEKLVGICKQTDAYEYISGPAAKDYIHPQMFADAGIKLTYMDYSGYSEYPQLYGEFVHGVSILDMLFNLGEQTTYFMKSFH